MTRSCALACLACLVCLVCLAPACGDRDQAAQVPAGAHDAGTPAAAPRLPHARRDRGYVAVIAAREATDVATELAGRVAAMHVQLGDQVTAGQLVATLDDRTAREDLAVAVAAQRAAEAVLSSARVEVEETARVLETERALQAQGTTSRADLDRASFAHDKALAVRAQAEAALAEQSARVSQLRARLEHTRLAAPFAGTVSMRYLDPGAIVAPGTPMIRLIASDELWVKFAVPSEDARLVAVGDRVIVEVEPAGIAVGGVVRNVAPELEPASQMIIAEADLALDQAQRSLVKAGQAARVHLRAP